MNKLYDLNNIDTNYVNNFLLKLTEYSGNERMVHVSSGIGGYIQNVYKNKYVNFELPKYITRLHDSEVVNNVTEYNRIQNCKDFDMLEAIVIKLVFNNAEIGKLCIENNIDRTNIIKTNNEPINEMIKNMMNEEKTVVFNGYKLKSDIKTLPREFFTCFSSIKSFIFCGSNLTHIPKDIIKFKNLNILILDNNKLKEVPDLSELSELTVFSAQGNGMYKFPPICNCTKLQVVNLENNNVKCVPETITKLTLLYYLDIHNNQIDRLPYNIGNLSKLKTLNVSHNSLIKLPHSIGKLLLLTDLNISSNIINEIPHTLCNLTMLTDLNISNNMIYKLPRRAVLFMYIKSLKIDDNFGRHLHTVYFEMITNKSYHRGKTNY